MKSKNNIGIVKLKEGTPDFAIASLENFFISKGLFISTVPGGIVVSDKDKAIEEVEKSRGKRRK